MVKFSAVNRSNVEWVSLSTFLLPLFSFHLKLSTQVGATGFEPTTSTSRTWRATGLRYAPKKEPKLHILLIKVHAPFGSP